MNQQIKERVEVFIEQYDREHLFRENFEVVPPWEYISETERRKSFVVKKTQDGDNLDEMILRMSSSEKFIRFENADIQKRYTELKNDDYKQN
jgi:hypothetical protein